jgi:hypothetical protein
MVLFPRKGVGKFQTSRFLKWKWWKVGGGNPCYRKQPTYRCFAFEKHVIFHSHIQVQDISWFEQTLSSCRCCCGTGPTGVCHYSATTVMFGLLDLFLIESYVSPFLLRNLKISQETSRNLKIQIDICRKKSEKLHVCRVLPQTLPIARRRWDRLTWLFWWARQPQLTRWMVSRWRVPAMKWISQRWAMSLGRFVKFQA